MTREEIIRNLKYTMEKHKNDTVHTFDTNISVMCKDILDYLEQESCEKTAHWEHYGDFWKDTFKCSQCGRKQPKVLSGGQIIGYWSNYCPNCGAKMESEEELYEREK